MFEFGGAFKKSHVSRQLKTMGLQRGKFTDSQVRGVMWVSGGSDRGAGKRWRLGLMRSAGAGLLTRPCNIPSNFVYCSILPMCCRRRS